MRPSARVQACIELLDQQQASKRPADRLQSSYYQQRRYIGSKDKAAVSELFYSVLRRRGELDHRLRLSRLAFSNRLRTALLVMLNGQHVESLFTGEKFAPEVLKAGELENLRFAVDVPMDEAPQSAQLNYPAWLEPDLKKSLGSRFDAEMSALQQRAPTDVRVNLLKTDRASVVESLKAQNIAVTICPHSPWGIRFEEKVALFNLAEFNQGLIEVQDEGSQLLALLTQVEAGSRVSDFCAGAGGKTLALSAMMSNKGSIWASDVHSKRLEQLAKRKKRADAHNIRTHLLSSENDKWVKQHAGSMDVVLIDAPCSGTGTWRRSPDGRWNLSAEDIQELLVLQAAILNSAKRLVKPGGRLFYATCSLLVQENEDQVVRFLSENEEFTASGLDLPKVLVEQSDSFLVNHHEFRSLPDLSGTDGFYLACLQREIDSDKH